LATSSASPGPTKLCGYTGVCPRVDQSGGTDRRGALAKDGPKYLLVRLMAAATNAANTLATATGHQRRVGRQRGAKVDGSSLARTLAEAISPGLSENAVGRPSISF
jgi:transposase